jgi:hypothetical protein
MKTTGFLFDGYLMEAPLSAHDCPRGGFPLLIINNLDNLPGRVLI